MIALRPVLRASFLGALLVSLCMAVAAPVRAEAPKIAVVDVQRLMSDSKAAQSIQKQLNEQRKSFQDEFSKLERDLVDTEKKLGLTNNMLEKADKAADKGVADEKDSKTDMAPEELAKKRQAFQEKLLESRKQVQKKRGALEEAFAAAMGQLRKEITQVIADMADKEGYTLVLSRQTVILAEKDLDITDAVLKKLDKKISDIKVTVESK